MLRHPRNFFLLLCCIGFGLVVSDKQCSNTQFQCENTKCISLAWRCDGDNDCLDKSDEANCPSTTCGESDFKCVSDSKCIPKRWACDDAKDCDDKSDEDPALCSQVTCPPDNFKCHDVNCILSSWVCDGETDCEGGEDEIGCNSTCKPSTEFSCGDGQCISSAWRCDKHKDCKDGADEENCPKNECSEFEFQCADKKCIQESWRCDGDRDCLDMSDEFNCTTNNEHKCQQSEFECKTLDRWCINSAWRCDGDFDCEDKSDEKNCTITCDADEFKCEENYCIPSSLRCDGQVDCINGSDEAGCVAAKTPCTNSTYFDCLGNGEKCIPYEKVCDGRNDCGNYEDERNANDGASCPTDDPCKVDNGGCEHVCHKTPSGPVCDCHPGYQLKEGSHKFCEDIDECNELKGVCSQRCDNTVGSYKCSCIYGYTLHNHTHCKANEGHPELLLANRKDLRRYQLETRSYTLLLNSENVSGAVAIDYHFQKKFIFWTDISKEHIMRINIETNTIETVVSDQIDTPDGLAIDWIHDHMYWTDTGRDQIEVSTLDGKMRKVLITENIDEPRGISVDPQQGYMYWTDWGHTPKIEKCGLNGKNRKVLIQDDDIKWPNGLTIDYVASRLYWIDAKTHEIGSSNLEGKDKKKILHGHQYLGHPFAITVFEDYLYWSDWPSESVRRYNKFQKGSVETVAQGLDSPNDIHVYHKYRQQNYTNRCGSNNGGCQQLCLPDAFQSYTCECAIDFYIDPVNIKDCLPENVTTNNNNNITLTNDAQSTNISHQNQTGISPPSISTVHHPITPVPLVPQISTQREVEIEISTAVSGVSIVTKANGTDDGAMPVTKEQEENIGHVAIIVMIIVIIIAGIILTISVIVCRRYRRKNIKSMNFDNPVYRKTTTDDQLIMEKNSSRQNLPASMQPLNPDNEIV